MVYDCEDKIMSYQLIHNSLVRAWMSEAYRRSNMGGLIPEGRLNPAVSERVRDLHRASDRVQREWGGKILRAPTGSLHCAFYTSHQVGGNYILPLYSTELNIQGNRIGQSVIIGSFHTHPCPASPHPGPSRADRQCFRDHPELFGSEHYVIEVLQVYVILDQGRRIEVVGRTRDVIWGPSSSR